MTDVDVVAPATDVVRATGVVPPEAMLWKHFARIATYLGSSNFVPEAYRNKPDEIMCCVAYGHELGLGPMLSLQSINVIRGKPTLNAEGMRSLIRSKGHTLKTMEYTNERVTLYGQRVDTGDEETVTFTMEDATLAELLGNATYRKYPRRMLLARCSSEIGTLLFSDVVMGLYTPDEMGDFDEAGAWDHDGPIPMDEPRRPAFGIVQDDVRHAGRVVRTTADPTAVPKRASFNWHWSIGDDFSGETRVCNACTHPCEDHGGLGASAGCSRCACRTVDWTPIDVHVVEGSGSPGDHSGGVTVPAVPDPAVNDGPESVEGADPPPPELSSSSTPARGGDRPARPLDVPHASDGVGSDLLTEPQRRGIHAALGANGLGDDARHDLVEFVTQGRTRSSLELTGDEASVLLNLLGKVKVGQLRVYTGDGYWSVVPDRPAGEVWLAEQGLLHEPIPVSDEPF